MMEKIPQYVSLSFPVSGVSNRLAVIKAIRVLSGLGLKEAKDLSETKGKYMLRVICSDGVNWGTGLTIPAFQMYKNAIIDLQTSGVQVSENSVRGDVLEDLRKLISHAVLNGEVDVACDLVNILKKYS